MKIPLQTGTFEKKAQKEHRQQMKGALGLPGEPEMRKAVGRQEEQEESQNHPEAGKRVNLQHPSGEQKEHEQTGQKPEGGIPFHAIVLGVGVENLEDSLWQRKIGSRSREAAQGQKDDNGNACTKKVRGQEA